MAFPTNTETGASLDAYIPLVWGEKVNEFYRNKLVAAAFFTDRSDELSGGGDTLYTPNTTEFAANAKVNATMVNTMASLIYYLKASIMGVYDYTMLYMQGDNRQTA